MGYPELTERAKRKILGLNSAKLYGIKTLDTDAYRPVPKDCESRMTDKLKTTLELGQLKADNMSKMKETYAALAIEPDNQINAPQTCEQQGWNSPPCLRAERDC